MNANSSTTLSRGLFGLATAAILALTSIPAAQAQSVTFSFGQRDRVIETYCDRYPRDRDCRGYYDGNWSRSDYNRFYNTRRGALDNIAAGFFGFTFGTILGAAIANQQPRTVYSGDWDAHVRACHARYRSYDEATDTFLGYDGVRHRCNL